MSVGANADYIRRWVEALNRRDLDALVQDASPDFEWVVAREHPEAQTHRGIDATLEYLREWLRLMPDLHVDVAELVERGHLVLTVIDLTGSGAGSGASTGVQTAMLSTFRDGVPVRTEEFLDPEEGRKALEAG